MVKSRRITRKKYKMRGGIKSELLLRLAILTALQRGDVKPSGARAIFRGLNKGYTDPLNGPEPTLKEYEVEIDKEIVRLNEKLKKEKSSQRQYTRSSKFSKPISKQSGRRNRIRQTYSVKQ
jgi:hypothetical protein